MGWQNAGGMEVHPERHKKQMCEEAGRERAVRAGSLPPSEDEEQAASSQNALHPARAQRDQRGALREADSYPGGCSAFPSALY